MNETRNSRRLRLACEPCRRKKTRCPGEKPCCSFCVRLGQACAYYEPARSTSEAQRASRSSDMESRIDGIEDKLDRLIDHMRPENNSSQRRQRPRGTSWSRESSTLVAEDTTFDTGNTALVESNVSYELRELGTVYLTWCHKQPMQLFDEDTFIETLPQRDKELILALEALSLRFPPGPLTKEKQQQLDSSAIEARRLVMTRVLNGDTRLSSLQSLCILSINNFAAGDIEKARLDLTIASHLKASYYTESSKTTYDDETNSCLQSVEILLKMHGCPAQAIRLMSVLRDRQEGSILPEVLGLQPDLEVEHNVYGELGGFASRLGDTWQMIRAYASSHVSSDSVPPWDSRSDYNIVMQSHLRIDCAIPMKYRFSPDTDLNNQTPEGLQKDRKRWSALLFLHVVYATVPCVLNHPFLLSMRLRNFRHIIPQSFVQQSYDHITRHAGWITYFISSADNKNFRPTDPCLAHCVVIVATIYLQHSFVETAHLRERAQSGLETCLRFLDRMGMIWPIVANMARNVRRLQQSVVPSPVGIGSEPPTDNAFSIDAPLLWDLLIYDRAGLPDAGVRTTYSSERTRRSAHPTPQDTAEFNLVGSAGISGHRSAGAHIPVYAPGSGEESGYANASVYADVVPGNGLVPPCRSTMEDIYGSGVDGFNDQMAPLFLADDYGRAIDGWLNYF